ncbi:GDP-L-fucose synthase [Candidatus Pelagibacter bacterium]|nr:GDP-L-fucose synthase [Candidatus Pelagibacter bacterium]
MHKKKVYIAGQEGMVGSSLKKLLVEKKFNVLNVSRKSLDLTNMSSVYAWFKKNKPDIVINAAARVGGIMDNNKFIHDYLNINMMIGFNLINASLVFKVKKFINLGSACIYPKVAKQPIKEDYLLGGYLESTNEGYALAKIASLKYCSYLKNKKKKNFISLQPANLYGVNDNYDLKSSHVIPALFNKFHNAKIKNLKNVEVWGSGLCTRDFLFVDDLANAIHFCINNNFKEDFLNVGSGKEISIKKIVTMIKNITGFRGKIFYNKSYPDGTPRRVLDITKIKKLGWKPKININNGLKIYYEWYLNQLKKAK